jgi:hypothetical protein
MSLTSTSDGIITAKYHCQQPALANLEKTKSVYERHANAVQREAWLQLGSVAIDHWRVARLFAATTAGMQIAHTISCILNFSRTGLYQ